MEGESNNGGGNSTNFGNMVSYGPDVADSRAYSSTAPQGDNTTSPATIGFHGRPLGPMMSLLCGDDETVFRFLNSDLDTDEEINRTGTHVTNLNNVPDQVSHQPHINGTSNVPQSACICKRKRSEGTSTDPTLAENEVGNTRCRCRLNGLNDVESLADQSSNPQVVETQFNANYPIISMQYPTPSSHFSHQSNAYDLNTPRLVIGESSGSTSGSVGENAVNFNVGLDPMNPPVPRGGRARRSRSGRSSGGEPRSNTPPTTTVAVEPPQAYYNAILEGMPDDFMNAIGTIMNVAPRYLRTVDNVLLAYMDGTVTMDLTGIILYLLQELALEELHDMGEGSGLSPREVELRMERYRFIGADQDISPEDVRRCCICLEDFATNDELGRLDCGHENHYDCIKLWLVQKNSCPLCKNIALAPPS